MRSRRARSRGGRHSKRGASARADGVALAEHPMSSEHVDELFADEALTARSLAAW
ncbi:MAG: hypothetical protein SFX73_20585 [Kofleriaceae bacterium]|nr:hypothetical protein [Kofleriaceae bacterium]